MASPSRMEPEFDWLESLREQRRLREMSQRALAARSGLALSTIKSYESRRRHPSREALLCLIDAIGIPREDANRILRDAGYALDSTQVLAGRLHPLTEPEIAEELAATPWPAFVTNQAFEVLFANRAIERTLGVTLAEFPDRDDRNLLVRMTDAVFARRLRNWDEVLMLMMGLAKGDPRRHQSLERPIPWLEGPVQRLLQGDPEMVQRVLQLWAKAKPVEHRLRHRYRIVWETDRGVRLAFTASFMPVDVWSELHWNEWIPSDGPTWTWLQRNA